MEPEPFSRPAFEKVGLIAFSSLLQLLLEQFTPENHRSLLRYFFSTLNICQTPSKADAACEMWQTECLHGTVFAA
jgi:hypothetical protein